VLPAKPPPQEFRGADFYHGLLEKVKKAEAGKDKRQGLFSTIVVGR
jgi:hypothetical protein